MGCRFAQSVVLLIAYVLVCQPPTHAQLTAPVWIREAQSTKECSPSASSDDKPRSGPEVTIGELTFEGDLHMTIADQEQIAASLRQRKYSGDPDEVISEVLKRVRGAWQERGYFNVQVNGNARVLTSNSTNERAAVSVHVDEGQLYQLREITFKNNRAVSNVTALRNLFPLKEGDLFNVAMVREGLEKLRYAYGNLGYINSSFVPDTTIDDERRTISLDIDMDEGKPFTVSNINILGLEESVVQNISKDLLLKPGDVYNQRLVSLFLQEHASLLPTDASLDSHILYKRDVPAATIAITFDFRHCTVE
jgi:outer membrane protein insertion porin family